MFFTQQGIGAYDSNLAGGLILAIPVLAIIAAIIFYVVSAVFQMELLKNAGHKYPVSAWVPFWNYVTLMEIGGIRQPWAWFGTIIGAQILGALLPGVGVVFSLAGWLLSIVVSVWVAKGVHAGMHRGGKGMIVLNVFLLLIWLIWAGVVSKKQPYDVEAAVAKGGTFPFKWFGEGDPRAPFISQDAQNHPLDAREYPMV